MFSSTSLAEGETGVDPVSPSHHAVSRLGTRSVLLQGEGVLRADDEGSGGALVARLEANVGGLGLDLLLVVAGGQVDLSPEEALGAGLDLQVVAAVGAVARDDEASEVALVGLAVVAVAEALEAGGRVVSVHLLLAARAHVAREEVLRLVVDEAPGLVGVALEDVERVGGPVVAGRAGVAVVVVTGALGRVAARAAFAVAVAAARAGVVVRADRGIGAAASEGGGDDEAEGESEAADAGRGLHDGLSPWFLGRMWSVRWCMS